MGVYGRQTHDGEVGVPGTDPDINYRKEEFELMESSAINEEGNPNPEDCHLKKFFENQREALKTRNLECKDSIHSRKF